MNKLINQIARFGMESVTCFELFRLYKKKR